MNTSRIVQRTTSFVRGAAGATALALLVAAPAPEAAAQQLSCTAALDVDVHYCLDESPAFPQTCDPLNMQDGDTVSITVEVTNDSSHNVPPPPPDPPSGRLQVGQSFKVFYACSASTCSPGQELPGWFGFVAVDYVEPGMSFSDDGNGFSGTLTVTAPVVYPEADAMGRHVLRIRTIAHMPPAIENSTVFARSEGTPAALLVTDNHCLAGLTGTGEGSTGGRFGGLVKNCGNRGRIVLKNPPALDLLSISLRSLSPLSVDPSTEMVTLEVTNANGVCFSTSLPAGAVVLKGNYYRYANDQAKNPPGGIKKITIWDRRGQAQIYADAYGDLSACNMANMTTRVMIGNVTYSHVGTWIPTPTGWRLPLGASQ